MVASGSTSGPSSVALCLRTGWRLGDVQDRYFFAQEGGDQYVGRSVCGLNPNSPEFATLPPHIIAEPAVIKAALDTCFPNAPSSLAGVLELVLASVVFHADSLREVAASHPVFNTALFASGLFTTLRPLVRSGSSSVRMQPSGIPPHVAILTQLQGHQRAMEAIVIKMETIAPAAVQGVVEVLEARAIGAGTVTFAGLEALLEQKLADVMASTGLADLAQRLVPGAGTGAHPLAVAQQRGEPQQQVHMWGGSFRSLPNTFRLPTGGIRIAWLHYMCPNNELGYPPLRGVAPRDVIDAPRGVEGVKNQRKHFSDTGPWVFTSRTW